MKTLQQMNIKKSILSILILILGFNLQAQDPKYCIANFGYNVRYDISPFTYQFSDSSSSANSIVSWEWNFGNGEISNKQNPEHQYFTAGIYTVSLKIIDQIGCVDFVSKSIEIIGIPPPSCSSFFTFTQDTTAPNYTFQFFDHSIHTNDTIISWSWNFGDSSPIGHLQHPTHNYSSTGNYYVKLDIITANNCSSSYTALLIINSGGVNCGANFTYSPDTNSTTPNTFVFHDNSLHSSPILEWKWYFGDGDSSSYQDPSHSYLHAGIYNVKLTITTTSCSSDIQIPIQVGNPQNYNLWGRVYVGNLTTDQCVAYIYKVYQNNYLVPFDTVALSSVNDTLGVYYFYQLPEGDYKVQVVLPVSSQFASLYAPTYFNSSLFWNSAQNIPLFQDLSLQNINMTSIQSQVGTDFISGHVINEANGQIANILVLLITDQGEVVNYTYTDLQGNYQFNDVPQGTMYVFGELAGFASYPAAVNFTSNFDSLSQVNFLIKGKNSVGFIDSEQAKTNIEFRIYPNPLEGSLFYIQQSAPLLKDGKYIIYNALGSIIQQGILYQGNSIHNIQISDLQKGMYLISIYNGYGEILSVKKLIN